MKKLYKYIVFVIGILAFCACTDETDFPSVAEEGNDVILNLNLKPEISNEIVNSRAETYENKLYDLHIYVFNSSGKLTGYEKLVDNDGAIASPDPVKITVRTKTGTSYIYALANINSGSTYKLDLSDADIRKLNVTDYATNTKTSKEEVNALRTAVEDSDLNMEFFLGIKYKRTLPTTGNEVLSPTPIDNKFMMSGYLNDGNAVTIQKNGTSAIVKENVNVIKLYRILAKNTLYIKSPIDGTTKKTRFTPKSYRLYNVPVGGQLVPNAKISTANTAADYTTGNITIANVESHYQLFSNESTFTFYYPENLQTTTSTITGWKYRETNSYASGSKTFTNAPDKSAYIEIQGDYIDSNNKITANATYTVHLGHFSKSLSDFNVIRNNHYIYTVNINGVDDIVAESKIKDAENNDVDNPYAEGFVIKAGSGQHFEVDAHYEARVMAFNMSEIWALKNSGKGYILSVETPFSKTNQTVYVKNDGVYSLTGTKLCEITNVADIFTDTPDFEWIKFVKNTNDNRTNTNNDISKYTCKYPGDTSKYSSSNPGGWMNVFELLAELHNNASATNTGTVYYTCFVDENYYANKPWVDYVNRDPRTMQIANNIFISEDKKSIYAEVAYSISQRSIATFYKDNSLVAFGTEIFDEEDLFHTENNPTRLGSSNSISLYQNLSITGANDWDGFTGTKNTNLTRKWYENETRKSGSTTYNIDVNNIENIQPLYKSAAKACMSRNRDLNGDGDIDDGEVRWYLASGGQYHALYIAKTSLPAESWLINTDDLVDIDNQYKANANNQNPDGRWVNDDNGHNYRGKYHYYTSSGSSTATYWPEEGLTLNPAQTSGWVSRAELVRCVRTLESGTSGEAKYGLTAPQKYYTFENNVFNLTGIETRRGDINEPLPNHNEIQDQNELYRTFQVATAGTASGSSLDAITGNATDPCSQYSEGGYTNWRTPNQKELGLMLAEMKSTMISGRYVPRTRFSGYKGSKTNGQFNNSLDALGYHWHDRVGFQIGSNGEYNLISNTNNVNVRCVRDVK